MTEVHSHRPLLPNALNNVTHGLHLDGRSGRMLSLATNRIAGAALRSSNRNH